MKKRIVCLLLVLCTLLSMLPVMAVSAEETLPRSEGEAVADGGAGVTRPEATLYDSLYVGGNGEKTANGGSLVGLYTAFGASPASVDLTAGKWLNMMDATGATDAVLYNNGSLLAYSVGENGGIFSAFTAENGASSWDKSEYAKIGIRLPDSYADLADFTVELMGRPTGMDGRASKDTYAYGGIGANAGGYVYEFRMDVLLGHFGANLNCTDPGGRNGMWWNTDADEDFFHNSPREKAYAESGNATHPFGLLTAYYTKTTTVGGVSFGVGYSNGALLDNKSNPYAPKNATLTKAAYEAERESLTEEKTAAGKFSFFNGQPAEVYAIRVYSSALTEAEKIHNRFIDLAAMKGLDMTAYAALDASDRSVVDNVFKEYGADADAGRMADTLYELINAMKQSTSLEDSLYVTDGLVMLLASYKGFDTGHVTAEGGISWFSALDKSDSAFLKGAGWEKNANGGFTIVMNYEDFMEDSEKGAYNIPTYSQFGLYLPGDVLPATNYTTEFVANPVGISQYSESGELERYIDATTKNGIYSEYGIAIGPLRAMQFTCYRSGGSDGQMERRWLYTSTGGHTDTWVSDMKDTVWSNLAFDDVVTFGITHSYQGGEVDYAFYHNQNVFTELKIASDRYKTPVESGNMFQLMVGVAGTMYAVRVYDRALSVAEMEQNHAADLIYYYGLDTSRLDMFTSNDADVSSIFSAFADMGFDMTPEEAQKELDRRMSAIWLSYAGTGVRDVADGKDGIRFYFDISMDAINAMTVAGFTLELGFLVNLDRSVLPALEGDAYDYKVATFDSLSGRNAPFYVDADTFALTLHYTGLEKRASLTPIAVRGYAKLTDADGNDIYYYSEIRNENDADTSLFTVYEAMADSEGVKAKPELRSRLDSVVNSCYEKIVLHLSATAARGGNGTAAKPFDTFATAFAALKAKMKTVATPTQIVLMAGDGIFGVYGNATLTGADQPYPYTKVTFASENGKTVYATTKEMDTSKFVSGGSNIWTYQFDKDENGNYPTFRYLYVDGKMMDVAYSSGRFAADEDVFVTQFDHTSVHDFEGIYYNAQRLYETGMLTYETEAPYPADRASLRARFNKYKARFVALMDVDALKKAGTLATDSPSAHPEDDEYTAFFNSTKLTVLAITDLRTQFFQGGNNKEEFKSYTPKFSSDAAYANEFIRLRDLIVADKQIGSFDKYLPTVEFDASDSAFKIGKIYLPLDMIGDLKDEMLASKERVTANAKTALAQAKAETAAAQSERDRLVAERDAKQEARDAAKTAYENAAFADKESLKNAYWAAERAYQLSVTAATNALNLLTAKTAAQAEAQARVDAMLDDEDWRRFALDDYGLEIHQAGQWWYELYHLTGIDYDDTVEAEDGSIHVACFRRLSDGYMAEGSYTMKGRYVCAKNAKDYADSEGEFYYDSLNGKLYYYSEGNMKTKDVSYPTSDYMFVFEGVRDVSMEGLGFTGVDDYNTSLYGATVNLFGMMQGVVNREKYKDTQGLSDAAAVSVDSCYGMSVYDCEFYELGAKAFNAFGRVEDLTVEGCSFTYIGANAIYVGRPRGTYSLKDNSADRVRIADNYMYEIGLYHHNASALVTGNIQNSIITQNTVENCSYTAYSIGDLFAPLTFTAGDTDSSYVYNMYNLEVSYNYCANFMRELGDGGGIYLAGLNSQPEDTELFNKVHHNYILMSNTTGNGLGHMLVGIYFDASTSNWKCYENVVVEQSYGAFPGENDGFDLGDPEDEEYLRKMRNRYSGTTFIYIQHIDTQLTHNILCDNNYIVNVRATDPEQQRKEVYKTYINADRNITETNTRYVKGVDPIPAGAEDIIYGAGSYGHMGDPSVLWNDDY